MLMGTKRESLRLAAAAGVDQRTAEKWLRGQQVRGGPGEALEREAERMGVKRESVSRRDRRDSVTGDV